MYRLFLLLCLIFHLTLQADEEKRLLIIGNSYTFCNDLPALLQAMANADRQLMQVDSYTAGAMSLRGFLNSPQHRKGLGMLEKGNYDYILLQDQSQTPAYKPEETLDSVQRWSDLARKHGAKPVLFMTWAHAEQTSGKVRLQISMHEDTALTYCNAAIQSKARVAPVGEAWRRWYAKHPNSPLHTDDMSHPTPEGTYLAACVIYSTITGRSATAIPVRLKNSPVRIPAAKARELQKIAAATLKNFTPAKLISSIEERDSKRPSAEEARNLLTRNMTLSQLTEQLGPPIMKQKNGTQLTCQFRLKNRAELAAYCTPAGKVLQVSIAAPNSGVQIIDLSKLDAPETTKK